MRKISSLLFKAGLVVLLIAILSLMVIFGMRRADTAQMLLNHLRSVVVVSLLFMAVGAILGYVNSRALRKGPLVLGTVIQSQLTGFAVNNYRGAKITVTFTTAEGRRITTTGKKMVAQFGIGVHQPGEKVPLRYNPKDPEDIMLVNRIDPGLNQRGDAEDAE